MLHNVNEMRNITRNCRAVKASSYLGGHFVLTVVKAV